RSAEEWHELNDFGADPKRMNIAKKNAQNRAKKKTKAIKDLSRLLKDAMNLGAKNSINRALCEERLYPVLAASPPFHLRRFHKCVVVRNSDYKQNESIEPEVDLEQDQRIYVPIKVNVFAWRARLDRLPTRDNLAKRGVIMVSSLCPICGLFPENAQHLFFGCDLARSIALRICHRWNLIWTEISSFSEWNSWFASIRLSAKLKMLLEGVFLTFWWFIWSFRNMSIFEEPPPKRSLLFDDIVSFSFNWCVNRCSSSFSQESWFKNPYVISL
nr:RNA-directed DNA polymerase, eukaryota [Tanacetum cinerariifolium]